MAQQFLRRIDGRRTGARAGKDYEGEAVSDAEVRFKLGDRESWEADRVQLKEERAAKPHVLRVSQENLDHLATQPPYVTYNLLHCARSTVLAPSAVYRGLKRGEVTYVRVHAGWAFCGTPSLAYDNQGRSSPPPEGMVFVVYADGDLPVFDWDWVEEDPEQPGTPVNSQMRFENPRDPGGEVVLDRLEPLSPGRFDGTKVCYSSRGDWVFCYLNERESFAERVHSDLTVFRALSDDGLTGFKVKNLQRIISIDPSIVISDAPDVTVRVDTVRRATRKLNPSTRERIYAVLIQALRESGAPSEIRIPRPPDGLVRA